MGKCQRCGTESGPMELCAQCDFFGDMMDEEIKSLISEEKSCWLCGQKMNKSKQICPKCSSLQEDKL